MLSETCCGCIGPTGASTNHSPQASLSPTLTQTTLEHTCSVLSQIHSNPWRWVPLMSSSWSWPLWRQSSLVLSLSSQARWSSYSFHPAQKTPWYAGFSNLLWSSCSRLVSSDSCSNFKAFAASLHSTHWPGDFFFMLWCANILIHGLESPLQLYLFDLHNILWIDTLYHISHNISAFQCVICMINTHNIYIECIKCITGA